MSDGASHGYRESHPLLCGDINPSQDFAEIKCEMERGHIGRHRSGKDKSWGYYATSSTEEPIPKMELSSTVYVVLEIKNIAVIEGTTSVVDAHKKTEAEIRKRIEKVLIDSDISVQKIDTITVNLTSKKGT